MKSNSPRERVGDGIGGDFDSIGDGKCTETDGIGCDLDKVSKSVLVCVWSGHVCI